MKAEKNATHIKRYTQGHWYIIRLLYDVRVRLCVKLSIWNFAEASTVLPPNCLSNFIANWSQLQHFPRFGIKISQLLTHCDPMMPYSANISIKYGLSNGLLPAGATSLLVRRQSSTCTNVDLSPIRLCGTHVRPICQQLLTISTDKMRLKCSCESLLHLLRAND